MQYEHFFVDTWRVAIGMLIEYQKHVEILIN